MSYRLAAFMAAAIVLATGNVLAAVTYLNDSKVMDSDWNVSTDGLNLAYNTSANETIVLDVGAWSLTINGNLIVGHNRLGTLNLGSGNVNVLPKSGNVGTYIGLDNGSVGIVNIDGGVFTAGGAKPFYIGQTGTGTLNLNSGAVVSTNEVYIGNNAGGVGVVNVNGGHFDARSKLYVGVNGIGTLNLNGGTVDVANDLNVGEGSGSGTIKGISGDLHQNGSWKVFNVGKGANSTGTVIKEGGDWSCNYLRIGTGSGSTGSFTQNGGTMTVTTELSVGYGDKSTGSFTINGGSVTLTGNNFLTIGRTTGSTATMTVGPGGKYTSIGNNDWGLLVGWDAPGTLNIAGGEVETRILSLCNALSAANSEVNITDGGALAIDYVKYTSNTRSTKINIDGGKVKRRTQNGVLNTFLDANENVTVSVGDNGAEFDANGYDIAINEDLKNKPEEAGKVRFSGGGTITLGGANSYTGGTTIELGTQVIASTEAAKAAVLENGLVVDGRSVLNATDYTVFEFSAGSLTDDVINNVSYVNCADGTAAKVVDGTKIVVTLAEATCVPKKSGKLKIFEDKTLDDIVYGKFSARMCGAYLDDAFNVRDAAKGYNKKLYYANGNLTSIIVEFQVRDGSNTKCVVVEFTEEGGSVYAKGLGSKYSTNAIGYEFYERNRTWHGSDPNSNSDNCYAETIAANGYGVCDIRVAVEEATEWTLDQDRSWSDLRAGATLNGDSLVRIIVAGDSPTLTIDEDVNVAKIEFVNGFASGISTTSLAVSADVTVACGMMELGDNVCVRPIAFTPASVTLLGGGSRLLYDAGESVCATEVSGLGYIEVASGATLYVDGDVRAAYILNNGIVVKTGDGTVAWPFNNASKGVTIVRNGTLKVASCIGDGTSQTVRVASGATFDMNGVPRFCPAVTMEEGAYFVNTGTAIDTNTKQTISLTLKGNAAVTAGGNFGLLAADYGKTSLALGSNTLTINGTSGFWLCNTTIIGDGIIAVNGGTVQCVYGHSNLGNVNGGEDWTLNIGVGGTLRIDNDVFLTVKKFHNGGTVVAPFKEGANLYAQGTLEVTGTLTSGNSIPILTLANGATIKATGTAQVVSTTFSASGTIYVDASAITKEDLKNAANERIPVLTVPATFSHRDVTWQVVGSDIPGLRARWETNEGGATKTLYVCRSSGTMIIVR